MASDAIGYWDTSPGTDSGADSAYDGGAAVDSGRECPVIDPAVDSDQDGLLDVVEDADRDCTVGYGETDPHASDSDRDGLMDGEEDRDRDGVYEPDSGEFDPTRADSDGDGVRDSEEPQAVACRAQGVESGGTLHVVGDSGVVYAVGADAVLTSTDERGAVITHIGGAALSVVYPSIALPLAPSDAVGTIGPAIATIGGRVRAVSDVFSHGAGRAVSELVVELERPLSVSELIGALGEIPAGFVPVPETGGLPSERFGVRIEADVDESGRIDGRVVASVWPADLGSATPSRAVVALSSVSGAAAARASIVCGEAELRAAEPAGLVLVFDPALAGGPAADAALGAIDQLVVRRREAGATTRVWLVAADAGSAPGGGREVTLRERGALQRAASELVDLAGPPTPWASALAAVDTIAADNPELRLVVVPIVGAEDAEFVGFTSDIVSPLCGIGAAIQECAFTVAERLTARGVDIVALGPGESSGAADCEAISGGREAGVLGPEPTSYRLVTAAAGGAHVDLCDVDAAAVLGRVLAERLPVGRVISLSESAIAPSAVVIEPRTLEVLLDVRDLGTTWPGDLAISGMAGEGPVGVSYRQWEL